MGGIDLTTGNNPANATFQKDGAGFTLSAHGDFFNIIKGYKKNKEWEPLRDELKEVSDDGENPSGKLIRQLWDFSREINFRLDPKAHNEVRVRIRSKKGTLTGSVYATGQAAVRTGFHEQIQARALQIDDNGDYYLNIGQDADVFKGIGLLDIGTKIGYGNQFTIRGAHIAIGMQIRSYKRYLMPLHVTHTNSEIHGNKDITYTPKDPTLIEGNGFGADSFITTHFNDSMFDTRLTVGIENVLSKNWYADETTGSDALRLGVGVLVHPLHKQGNNDWIVGLEYEGLEDGDVAVQFGTAYTGSKLWGLKPAAGFTLNEKDMFGRMRNVVSTGVYKRVGSFNVGVGVEYETYKEKASANVTIDALF